MLCSPKMWAVVCILVLISFFNFGAGLSWLLKLGDLAHDLCVRAVQPTSDLRELYSAISCGASLPRDIPIYFPIFESGLAHLFVVSGAHMVLIDRWIGFLVRKGWISDRFRWPLLTLFLFTSRLNPPILRAWLDALIVILSLRFEWNLRKSHSVLLSGLVSLALFPNLWASLSLQLSWLATLSLVASERLKIQEALGAYLFLLPLTILLQPLHPISVPINFLVGGLFAVGLFPLILVATFIPGLSVLTDSCLYILLELLSHAPKNLAYSPTFDAVTGGWIWVIVLSLNWLLIWTETKARYVR